MRTLLAALTLSAAAIGGVASAQYEQAPQARPMPGMRGGGMMRADADHDGVVTRAEAMADADRRFARMDANHDGAISADEMAAYRQQMFQRRGQDVPPPGGARHAPGMGRRADPDGSGTISRDEFRARAMARFDRMDANHDGRIDSTEMANQREMHHVRMQERRGDQAQGDDGR